jgi:hypothetical protein
MFIKLPVASLPAFVAVLAFDAGAHANDQANLQTALSNAVKNNLNMDSWPKTMCDRANNYYNKRYNVMVFNTNQTFDASQLYGVKNSTQVILYQTLRTKPAGLTGHRYFIWVFDSGTFVNKGDAGSINWAFAGNFKRSGNDGKAVVFSTISGAAPAQRPAAGRKSR